MLIMRNLNLISVQSWTFLYTLEIKIPRQFTTLNVKGAARDHFDVFMGINHRKYSSYSLTLCSFLWYMQ